MRHSAKTLSTISGLGAGLALAVSLFVTPAWAETTAPAAVPAAPAPAGSPDAARTVPEQIAPAAPTVEKQAVLVPPPIDPSIKVPLKTQTKDPMPVINPPAAPNGSSGAVAK